MRSRHLFLALGVTSVLASSAVPASAQVGDFFCSTFSIGCEPPPPPPPPPPPVVEEPAPKKVKRAKKVKPKRTAAPKAAEQTAAPQ